ncbi:hypothetical protein RJ641_019956 [Dillenia turbinata]|uniref:Uncharacterized protein n=1 Tax=Dillenia turbinata TaxID=194707 RepID=A0AAN8UL74_9MAGN
MEENVPVIAKKIWKLVRFAYHMLRKGISKRKILVDLNMMMKRGKIAGTKAFHHLMFDHQHSRSSSSSSTSRDQHVLATPRHEYEFSCSHTPVHSFSSSYFPFRVSKRRNSRAAHAPPMIDGEAIPANAVNMVLELFNNDVAGDMASPYLPGYGQSPMVRPLRITDSPFPLRNTDEEETRLVNKAVEEFIKSFYNDLKGQNRITQ